jgi:hypothetical protein
MPVFVAISIRPLLSTTQPRLDDTKLADTALVGVAGGVVVVDAGVEVDVATTPGLVDEVGATVVELEFVTEIFFGPLLRVAATTPPTPTTTTANASALTSIRPRRVLATNCRARISTPSRCSDPGMGASGSRSGPKSNPLMT